MTKPQMATLQSWAAIKPEAMSPDIARQFFSSEHLTVARFELKKGAFVPGHAHDNEQIALILKGAMQFRFGPDLVDEMIVRAGEMVIIPANLQHSAVALEDTIDLDIFNPPRGDWLDQADAYLRVARPEKSPVKG